MSCGCDVDKRLNHRYVNAGRSEHAFHRGQPSFLWEFQSLEQEFVAAAIN